MHCGGDDIDLGRPCWRGMPPAYIDRLRVIFGGPVGSASFFHETVGAVLRCILRFNANDRDDGALGSVKGYVGMTEDPFELFRTVLLRFLCTP